MADLSQVEEAFNRLASIKTNKGLFVMNGDGIAIRSTMENDITVHYAALVSRFIEKARSMIKLLSSEDELEITRVRSKKHEIVIAPDFAKGQGLYLVAIHNPFCE